MKYISIACATINDTNLLVYFRQDKKTAFDFLYKKYWCSLVNFSMKYLNDQAACEDIVQEFLIGFYKDEYFLKIKTSLSSYLYTALRNRILNYLRKQSIYKKHLSLYRAQITRTINSVDKKMAAGDFEKTIIAMFDNLPDKYREVYTLRYDHELTIKKISCLLNRPVDTVEKQSRKITGLLRKRLATARAD